MPAVTAHRRVRWGGVLGAVVVAALLLVACGDDGPQSAPTTVPATTTTTTTAPTTTTTMATTTTTLPAPRKVLILGDSTMVDASPGITAMFEASGATVVSGAGPGFGLTRLGTSQQPSPYPELFTRLVAEEQPDLVVVMLGTWDLGFIEQNGPDAYAAIVDDAMTRLVAGGARVLWLAVPPGGATARVQNVPFQQARANHVGAVYYVDYDVALRGPDGGYPVSYVAPDGSTVHLRKADNFHFCPDGSERIAAQLNARAVELGLMRPVPDGWQHGAWRSAGVYDEPVCG